MSAAYRFVIILAFGLSLLAPPAAQAVGLGKTCGGIAGIACNKGLFCEHKANNCKTADASGTCVKAPEICTQLYQPVCGCNGKTYANDCLRRAAHAQLAHVGPCK